MSIETYGTGMRLRAAAGLAGKKMPNAKLILLPVPTTRDNKYVSGTDILLEDTLANAEDGFTVVGYGMPDWFIARLREKGAQAHELTRDEEFMRDNAYVTAVGTIGYILATENRVPSDISFGVVGYGRIGSSLVRLLLFLGARVKVFTSRMLTRIDLGECGVNSSLADISVNGYDFEGVDILINTAPKDMSGKFPGGKLPEGLRVLELASGDNFNGVDGVEKLSALPEKMYPESAGRAYFESVRRFLEKGDGK
ncbi:MAG: hypothetical protein E7612_11140 [Ruminococcaceae bacterium]|nr:hypothetical protein [Oscillospiraceae bacterium]